MQLKTAGLTSSIAYLKISSSRGLLSKEMIMLGRWTSAGKQVTWCLRSQERPAEPLGPTFQAIKPSTTQRRPSSPSHLGQEPRPRTHQSVTLE